MDNPILTPAIDRPALARRIAALRDAASLGDAEALREYARIELDFDALAEESRATLLGTSLTWSEEDLREAAWLRQTNDSLALIGYAFCQALASRHGGADPRTQHMVARTLYHMGSVVKWEVAVTRGPQHDFAKPHALMRAAMAGGYHREPLQARFDGREATCTIESLYFRALLLARFSSGVLNSKQIEILDAWMWMWMPALQGVSEPPAEGALRADLDSRSGLQLGPRPDAGPALYIPPGPVEEAYRHIVREFQAGRMVPQDGLAATFRLEEHVAVLDLIRQRLNEATNGLAPRAPRRETSLRVELHVGLAEVLTRGLCPLPPAAPKLTLATLDGERQAPARGERDRDTAADSSYERRRRMVRVANESDTGLGLEGDERDCGGIAVGDIVALRLDKEGPLEICRVVRSVPAAAPGRTCLGVRRRSSRARSIEVSRPGGRAGADTTLLFIPGDDASGRHDACLVSERAFAEAGALEATVEDRVYTFRFNRPRERGRGWVLAGFEVEAARAAGAQG
jgi:hypothetical protein